MAWVKLDDQAPRNSKMLKAGPAACWLWVCGIAHCQSQLTDGFISIEALPMIGVTGSARARRLADGLVVAGLFDAAEGGYQVHDYLDHNPSRATVLAKRAEDSERKRGPESARNPNGIQPDSRARARVPSHPIPSHPEREKEPVSVSPPADPFVDTNITERAGRFIERYEQLYQRHRGGARYVVNPQRDYAAAVPLCQTWADDRLDKLAIVFLGSNNKFAEEGSRTIPQFKALASWCDGKLAEFEAGRGAAK